MISCLCLVPWPATRGAVWFNLNRKGHLTQKIQEIVHLFIFGPKLWKLLKCFSVHEQLHYMIHPLPVSAETYILDHYHPPRTGKYIILCTVYSIKWLAFTTELPPCLHTGGWFPRRESGSDQDQWLESVTAGSPISHNRFPSNNTATR